MEIRHSPATAEAWAIAFPPVADRPPEAVVFNVGDDPSAANAIAFVARTVVTVAPDALPYVYRTYYRASMTCGLAVVLHRLTINGEVEIGAMRLGGMPWSRAVLRDLSRWIFDDMKIRRLVAKLEPSNHAALEFVRRLGFIYEGRARGYYPDNSDASVWSMLRHERPAWLTLGGHIHV